VCTHPCEEACARKNVDEPVNILTLKRHITDQAGNYDLPQPDKQRDERIAIVGSGPAGLTCAYELRKMGYQVTVFEALGVAGGMLAVGIPEYRLPKDILANEIRRIQNSGVEIKLNTPVGKNLALEDLRKEYNAVFLAVGAHVERRIGILGEDLGGVIGGVEFLRRLNLSEKIEIGERIVVVGGGNSAIDAARTAKRLGAKDVRIVYRRSRPEMPAAAEEVEEAEKEGVTIEFLTLPVKIFGGSHVTEVECIRMKLGEPDESGRGRPIPVEGSEFRMPCDMLVVTIGQSPDVASLGKAPGVEVTKWNTFSVDPTTFQTNVEGVFAGGDCVAGPDVVVRAMAAGKRAATSINRSLNKQDMNEGREFEETYESDWGLDELNVEREPVKKRVQASKLEAAQRRGFEEVNLGFTEDMVKSEVERCLNCGCRVCEFVCPTLTIKTSEKSPLFDVDLCNGCRLCESRCPGKAIKMERLDEPTVKFVDPSEFDRDKIAAICLKAGYHPEQMLCFCTGTRADEVVAAILKGAKTPIELSRMTGIRSGCTVECIEPQIKLLEAAGIKVGPAPGWQWYGRTPSIWDIPEKVKRKFAKQGFYFEDDIKLRDRLIKARGDD